MNKWIIGAVTLAASGWWATRDDADPSTPQEAEQAAAVLAVKPRVDRNLVKVKLRDVRTALHMYNIDSGEVPQGFDEVVNSGLLRWEDVRDPWGQQFAFRSEKKAQSSHPFSEEYEIFVYSIGPDGVKGNADDIYM